MQRLWHFDIYCYMSYIIDLNACSDKIMIKDRIVETLVIVESPAKARTISRYLDSNYIVKACRAYPRFAIFNHGVNVKDNFSVRYITMPGKEKIIKELKTAAAQADRILLAIDPDREGEAIAWHLANVLDLDQTEQIRISFNEISSRAIKEAIDTARPLDKNLIDSQQSRRILIG